MTGANKGIGRAVVEAVLDRYTDVFVYLGCRSLERGTDARNQLGAKNHEYLSRTKVVELDVTSEQSSVRRKKVSVGNVRQLAPLYTAL